MIWTQPGDLGAMSRADSYDVGVTHLIGSDSVRKCFLHTLSRDGAHDEVRESRFQSHEEIQHSSLKGVVYE